MIRGKIRGCRCCRDSKIVGVSRRRFIATGSAALLSGPAIDHVLAQGIKRPAPGTAAFAGVVRQTLERHPMPGDRELVMNEVIYPPGAAAPSHHHPVAALNYILEGAAESAYGQDKPQVYRAGETLQDKANVPHTLFRNVDPRRPLRFLNVYVLAPGQIFTIVP